MLIDAVQSVGRFIKITAAKVNDQKFLKSLELISHSMIVFDKAYNYYNQFVQWTSNEVYFVTRMKKNAVYDVKNVTRVHYRKKDQAKVLRDEVITLEYYPEAAEGKRDTKTTLALELRDYIFLLKALTFILKDNSYRDNKAISVNREPLLFILRVITIYIIIDAKFFL